MEGLGLGLILVVGGLVFVLLVRILLRILLPINQPNAILPESSLAYPDSLNQKDAVLVIQGGGRVDYINESARQLFGLHGDEQPDLERLTRYTRPSNEFLSLLSKESQKRISVGTQLTEAASYRVPGLSPLMMVILRNLDLAPAFNLGDDGQVSASILRMVTDFGQSISSNLDLNSTLQAILENVGRMISADTLELKVWDEARQSLIPYRFEGRSGEPRSLRRVESSYFGSYTDSLLKERKPLLLSQNISENGELTNGATEPYAVRSYIGVPLIDSENLVGTLEVGQSAEDTFSQYDLEMLHLIAGQVAIAIRNALLFEAEQQRTTELTGLANLAQAVSVSQDLKDLFERLVKSVSPLFDVEIIGFLLYDEGKRTLEGQIPFQGLPPHIVEIYRANIPDDKAASDIIASQRPLTTINAGEDVAWDTLGIRNLAKAASLRNSVLVPLLSGRRLLGFMQLSNHRQGVIPFTEEELRLMNIVADQATAIVDNAVLVQQARQRAYRSDALRRIASLSASSASVDEVLEHSVRELAHLFQADSAAIFLLDEQNGELRLHSGSLYGVEEEAADVLSRMFVTDTQFRSTVSGSQKPFISGRLNSDRRVLPVYRPIVANLRMESSMVVPLVVRERGLGELMLGSRKPDFFNSYDLQVVMTAAGQLASALESARLVNQTDENLRTRVDQLTAIMRVSRELNASLNVNKLLELVHAESLRTTHADCGTILLFKSARKTSRDPIFHWLPCR